MHGNDNFTTKLREGRVVRFPAISEKAKIDLLEEERRQELLKILDTLRHKVADGSMDDVVIIARNLANNLFFTEVSIRQSTYKSPEIGMTAAMLNMVALECNEALTMSPYSEIDGTVKTPHDLLIYEDDLA